MSDRDYNEILALRNDRRRQLALQEQADATRGAICDAIKSKRPNLDECSPAVADYIRRIEFIQQSIWCEKCCADKKHPSLDDIADIMDGAADETIQAFEQVKADIERSDSDSESTDEARWNKSVEAYNARQKSMDAGRSPGQVTVAHTDPDYINRAINQLRARVAALELMAGISSQDMSSQDISSQDIGSHDIGSYGKSPQVAPIKQAAPCPASIFGDFD